MNIKEQTSAQSYSEEYLTIFKQLGQDLNSNQNQQWSSAGDYLVKFSLFDESVRSIASTGTGNVKLF